MSTKTANRENNINDDGETKCCDDTILGDLQWIEIEKKYYEAKSKRGVDRDVSFELFEGVIEEENNQFDGKSIGKYTFKSLKQMVKLQIYDGGFVEAQSLYGRILSCFTDSSQYTQNIPWFKMQKCINIILDEICKLIKDSAHSPPPDIFKNLFEITKKAFHPLDGVYPHEKLWVNAHIQYANMLLKMHSVKKMDKFLSDILDFSTHQNTPDASLLKDHREEIVALQLKHKAGNKYSGLKTEWDKVFDEDGRCLVESQSLFSLPPEVNFTRFFAPHQLSEKVWTRIFKYSFGSDLSNLLKGQINVSLVCKEFYQKISSHLKSTPVCVRIPTVHSLAETGATDLTLNRPKAEICLTSKLRWKEELDWACINKIKIHSCCVGGANPCEVSALARLLESCDCTTMHRLSIRSRLAQRFHHWTQLVARLQDEIKSPLRDNFALRELSICVSKEEPYQLMFKSFSRSLEVLNLRISSSVSRIVPPARWWITAPGEVQAFDFDQDLQRLGRCIEDMLRLKRLRLTANFSGNIVIKSLSIQELDVSQSVFGFHVACVCPSLLVFQCAHSWRKRTLPGCADYNGVDFVYKEDRIERKDLPSGLAMISIPVRAKILKTLKPSRYSHASCPFDGMVKVSLKCVVNIVEMDGPVWPESLEVEEDWLSKL